MTIDINSLNLFLDSLPNDNGSPTFSEFLDFLIEEDYNAKKLDNIDNAMAIAEELKKIPQTQNIKIPNHYDIKKDEENHYIIVNEEINLDFSEFSKSQYNLNNLFFFYNIKFLKKITINISRPNKLMKMKMDAKELQIRFYDSEIKDEFKFSGYEYVTLCVVDFCDLYTTSSLTGKIIFQKCNFEKFEMSEYANNKVGNELIFRDCKFKNKLDFANFTFNDKVIFKGCKFKKDVSFYGATFEKYVDFSQCVFKKIANFYGVTFKKTPNFSQADFYSILNIVNTKLESNYEEIKSIIIREQKDKNNNIYPTKKQKTLDEIANDFRDSFRIFKNILIKYNNNSLDASKFHKLELYCKEIELGFKEPERFSRDWIDKIILTFYRLTSDHHTDLLKIISYVITLIGIFATLLFGYKLYENPQKTLSAINLYGFGLSVAYLFVITIFIVRNKLKLLDITALFAIVPTMWLACVAPKYIFGIATIFTSEHSGFENFILVIYSILLFLLVFSLQKTARKNSIVPS